MENTASDYEGHASSYLQVFPAITGASCFKQVKGSLTFTHDMSSKKLCNEGEKMQIKNRNWESHRWSTLKPVLLFMTKSARGSDFMSKLSEILCFSVKK